MTSIVTASLEANPNTVPQDKPLAVGVIGCGHWGPNHIRAFATLPGARVSWAADQRTSRRDYVSSLYDRVRVTPHHQVVLDDPSVDAVVVTTPAETHYEIAMAAIEAGKHVLCEKPLCRSSRECLQLTHAATARGVVLMVGHTFLFNSGIRKLKDVITTDELGQIYYATATRTNLGPIRETVNASYDLASHEISIFNYLFDSAPLLVSATGRAYLNPGIEDVVIMTLTYPRDIIVGATVSWLSPKKVREITLVGGKKMATWNDLETSSVVIYDKGASREPYYDNFGEFWLNAREGEARIPRLLAEEPLKQQAQFFLEAVRNRSAGICDGERGWEVVRTLEAIDESVRLGGTAVPIERFLGAGSHAV